MSVEIQFNRLDKIYRPGEKVSGVVVVTGGAATKHNGIRLSIHGQVTFQLSARSIGVFEALYSSLKPLDLVRYELDVAPPDKLASGVSEFPFEFVLRPNQPGAEDLYETYRGVYVNVQYNASVEVKKASFGAKTLKAQKEFLVEVHPEKVEANPIASASSGKMEAFASSIEDSVSSSASEESGPESSSSSSSSASSAVDSEEAASAAAPANPNGRFNFKISPQALQNVKQSSKRKIPDFLFEGYLERTAVNINEPLLGELSIKHCAVDIKSIELQLVRVETYSHLEEEAREATEIQNIQIADGNIVRGLPIPVHMVFPRLFTCVSTKARNFKVQFEVNLIVLFHGDHMVTENLPIVLWR